MDALRKMTLMPARRLEQIRSDDEKQGPHRVGADADLTIFNPALVIDRSTFEEPAKYSEGIAHVLVGGVFVVKDGKLQPDVNPGRAIRGTA